MRNTKSTETMEKTIKQKADLPWMITVPKASLLTGLPEYWLREQVKNGNLKARYCGNRIYLWTDELREQLKSF